MRADAPLLARPQIAPRRENCEAGSVSRQPDFICATERLLWERAPVRERSSARSKPWPFATGRSLQRGVGARLRYA
jgi:hypothetical protein